MFEELEIKQVVQIYKNRDTKNRNKLKQTITTKNKKSNSNSENKLAK